MTRQYTWEYEHVLIGEFAHFFNLTGSGTNHISISPIGGWENLSEEVTSRSFIKRSYKIYDDDGSRVLHSKYGFTDYITKIDDISSYNTRAIIDADSGWVFDTSRGQDIGQGEVKSGRDYISHAVVNFSTDYHGNTPEASVALNEDGADLDWLSFNVSGGVLDASEFAFTAITEAGREFASKLEFAETTSSYQYYYKIKLRDGESVEEIPHEFTITVHQYGDYIGVFTIGGDAGANPIHGDSSDNTIRANSSNDQIYGNDGDDRIYGRAGDDTIYGGDGDDIINGGRGNDVIYGNVGNDAISGHQGDDVIYGGDGNDRISATSGNNRFYGGDGDDSIIGGTGDDYLNGGDGDDSLGGGDGRDILNGGNGDDTLKGGNQSDIFVLDLDNTGKDTVLSFRQGEDKIRITSSDHAQITIDGNVIRDADGNDVFVLKVFDGYYNPQRDFDGVLTIDDFDIIDDTMSYDGEVKIVTPKIEFLTPRIASTIDSIGFTFNRYVDVDAFNVVGIFDKDTAPAETIEVKLWGTDSNTDKNIYWLQVKEGESLEYNGIADYLSIQYDGEYVGGGAVIIDIA